MVSRKRVGILRGWDRVWKDLLPWKSIVCREWGRAGQIEQEAWAQGPALEWGTWRVWGVRQPVEGQVLHGCCVARTRRHCGPRRQLDFTVRPPGGSERFRRMKDLCEPLTELCNNQHHLCFTDISTLHSCEGEDGYLDELLTYLWILSSRKLRTQKRHSRNFTFCQVMQNGLTHEQDTNT